MTKEKAQNLGALSGFESNAFLIQVTQKLTSSEQGLEQNEALK